MTPESLLLLDSPVIFFLLHLRSSSISDLHSSSSPVSVPASIKLVTPPSHLNYHFSSFLCSLPLQSAPPSKIKLLHSARATPSPESLHQTSAAFSAFPPFSFLLQSQLSSPPSPTKLREALQATPISPPSVSSTILLSASAILRPDVGHRNSSPTPPGIHSSPESDAGARRNCIRGEDPLPRSKPDPFRRRSACFLLFHWRADTCPFLNQNQPEIGTKPI